MGRMMQGVEILASEDIVAKVAFNTKSFLVVVIVCVLAFFISSIPFFKDIGPMSVLIMCVIGCIFGLVIGSVVAVSPKFGKPVEYETEYKVTVSDDVCMNDFMEKYEIIDQEGKIFTVKERIDEDY